MTSELRVDKIHNEGGDNDSGIDLSTNDQIVLKTANTTRLTMNATGQTEIVGEGGSTTTNLQQGLAKMWVNYTGISTTAARDSFNVSSLTDEAGGKTTVNINNDMDNANYSGYYFTSASTGTAYTNFDNQYTGGFGSFAAGSCSQNAYSTGNTDSYLNLVGIFGDLA
jgi:hypothetical protein